MNACRDYNRGLVKHLWLRWSSNEERGKKGLWWVGEGFPIRQLYDMNKTLNDTTPVTEENCLRGKLQSIAAY